MNKFKAFILFAALIVFATGCSTSKGFNGRGATIKTPELDGRTTEEQIDNILGVKPQLDLPFKLGVYVLRGTGGSGEKLLSEAMLGEESEFESFLAEMKSSDIISEVVTIPASLVDNKDNLDEIRVAAARYGADAVLIINSIDSVDRYNNWSSILYLSIIGLWIIPGTNVDALSVVQGLLFDVRNGYLYFSFESEGRDDEIGTAVLLKNRHVLEKSRKKAALKFLQALRVRLEDLKPDQ